MTDQKYTGFRFDQRLKNRMRRNIPWDDLPHPLLPKPKSDESNAITPITEEAKESKEFNLMKDLESIGRRVAFGAVVSKEGVLIHIASVARA